MKKGENQGSRRSLFPKIMGMLKLAGKEAVFKIVAKDIKEKHLPELDDDFAKDLGEEYSNLEELKQGIREKFQAEEEKKNRQAWHKELMKAIAEKNPIEVPEVMVARHKQSLMERMQLPKDEGEAALKPEEREWLEKQALEDVTWSLISEKIAEKEGIAISSEEVEEGLAKHAAENSMSTEAMKDYYTMEMGSLEPLRLVLLNEKILDFLLENAKVTEEGSREKKE